MLMANPLTVSTAAENRYFQLDSKSECTLANSCRTCLTTSGDEKICDVGHKYIHDDGTALGTGPKERPYENTVDLDCSHHRRGSSVVPEGAALSTNCSLNLINKKLSSDTRGLEQKENRRHTFNFGGEWLKKIVKRSSFSENDQICSSTSLDAIRDTQTDEKKFSSLPRSYPRSKRIHSQWPQRIRETLFLPSYPVDHAKFGSYQLVATVSSGKFGKVCKVVDESSKETFALKVQQKSDILTMKMAEQVKVEVDLQNHLPYHPFIHPLLAAWQSRGSLYHLTAFCDHGDLYNLWTREKSFPEHDSSFVMAEIALALDFLHEEGIVYRDLKMENVLISGLGHILISDFGLAKRLRRTSRTFSICGTLKYMAPEVASGIGYCYQVDWWSFAVLGFALLSGKFPFASARDHFGQLGLLKSILPASKTCDPILKEICQKMLCYRADLRLKTIQEVKSVKLFANIDFDRVLNAKDGPLLKYVSEVHEEEPP